jgi:arsenate reductase
MSAPTVAFVCVRNAGRSQMAAAFAERERAARGLDVEVVTGGTDPAEAVHDVVERVMAEVDIDLSGREPRLFTREDAAACDYVITMGCSAEGVCPVDWTGDARDWDLEDPGEADAEAAREIRDEIERRVVALFDEFEG